MNLAQEITWWIIGILAAWVFIEGTINLKNNLKTEVNDNDSENYDK